jgi:NADPH-dependent glutamate synthase beta subunit-like oxidoreductase
VIDANPLTTETRLPGIFAGGDAIFGPATATEAMLTGKRAAFSIDKYLKGLKDLI